MDLCFEGGRPRGTIDSSPSKSHTHRAFFMAALSEEENVVRRPLLSQDTMSTLGVLEKMGAGHMFQDGSFVLGASPLIAPTEVLDAGNSGTTMRILAGTASSLDAPVSITGDSSLRKRPMGPLLDALGTLGVECESHDGRPPITVKGPLIGGEVSIRGDMSSQFITSLLMAAPLAEEDVVIRIDGKLLSRPYVDITLDMLRRFGIRVRRDDDVSFQVSAGQRYRGQEYSVPGDFSSAAFPLSAAALNGAISMTGLDLDDPQGDKAILNMLSDFGADVTVSDDKVTVASGHLTGTGVNMGNTPDLFPIIAVIASVSEGTSTIYNAPQLRFKESDRIHHTVRMLKTLGADIEERDDGCVVNGVKTLKGGFIDPVDDHRLAMAAAVASIVSDGPVGIKDADCHSVSYPGFLEDMTLLGIGWRRMA